MAVHGIFFNVHLTPGPVDFRVEEHERLSVTMEHLVQMSSVHIEFRMWH